MSDLRDSIIKAFKKYGDHPCGSPTWWFKSDTGYKTPEIRRELYSMVDDGLVVKTNHSRIGQAHWRLVEDIK